MAAAAWAQVKGKTRNDARLDATRAVARRELFIDPSTREVRVGERRVELANKESALLRALASEPHRVFGKEELLRAVWGFQSMGSTRARKPYRPAVLSGET